MKAKLVSICLLILLTLSMSSCFLKPKYHFNDHRGVYKDRGVTKDEIAHREEMKKRRKHHKKHHKKKHAKGDTQKETYKGGNNKKAKDINDPNAPVLMDTTGLKGIPPHVEHIDTVPHTDNNPQPGQTDQNIPNNNQGQTDQNNLPQQNAIPPDPQSDMSQGDLQNSTEKAVKKDKKKTKKKKHKKAD